jgi:hypothetical protein
MAFMFSLTDSKDQELMCSIQIQSYLTLLELPDTIGKSEVVPVLFLTEHHAMKAYRRVEV